jgi:hypothetical protein
VRCAVLVEGTFDETRAWWVVVVRLRMRPPVVRDDAQFVARLTPEHRQLFLDVLAGVDIMALESYAQERMIRDLVRAGEYSLVPCSVLKDDERFHTKAVWARIAAGQRAVAGAEAARVMTEGLAHDGGEESTVAANNEDRKKKAKKLGIMSSHSCLNMVRMLCGAIGGSRSRRGDGDGNVYCHNAFC